LINDQRVNTMIYDECKATSGIKVECQVSPLRRYSR